MTKQVDTEEALRHAIRSILDGPGDPRSVDGAKVNALQSIAWSLIGLLAKGVDLNGDAQGSMAELVDRAGLLAEVRP